LAGDNILINWFGGANRVPSEATSKFREYFPVRYYITDFELAVVFDYDSDPVSRVVRGYPFQAAGRVGEYGRDVAPQFRKDEPYCPFRTDIWQLGNLFRKVFKVSD
jgi:hypothetical protein